MTQFQSASLTQYLDQLAAHTAVPGGGSAAALTGASGAALISMVAAYSLNKGRSKMVEQRIRNLRSKAERIRRKLTALVDLDAEAYLAVVSTRKAGGPAHKRALKKAQAVPQEICKLSREAVDLLPYLAENGNPYLLSDVEVAAELLSAAFQSAEVLIEANHG